MPVGEEGNIRFVETPEVSAPVAFGLRDRVVALPPRFMHLGDRKARDLAIAHELAHHRGGDILANFAAQLLLAVHWFNPIAWIGWRAMRRDQEAACDARVMAGRPAQERADYGQVIASFAAGPHLALAAPMACPVLGEKSIIHRLRSLNMNNLSRRRRIASRFLIGGAALALPLTASISYAEVSPPPAPPEVQAASVAAAPAAPFAPAAPDAPAPIALALPVPPVAPMPPEEPQLIQEDDSPTKHGKHKHTQTWVVESEDGKKRKIRREVIIAHHDQQMSAEERSEAMKAVREAMKEVDTAMIEAEVAREMALVGVKHAGDAMTAIRVECNDRGHSSFVASGRKVKMLCSSEIRGEAITALREAQEGISENDSLDKDLRKEILRQLDDKIRELKARS